jgi:hydrogenase expression/formation protein HypC
MCLAIPGKIESISGDDPLTRMGKVNFGGILKEACLAYVPEAKVGDYVIVHVGFALSRVDEDEAQKVFEYLKQIEELGELQEAAREISRRIPRRRTRAKNLRARFTASRRGRGTSWKSAAARRTPSSNSALMNCCRNKSRSFTDRAARSA